MIYYRNATRGAGVDARALKATAKQLLEAVGESGSALSVSLVSDRAIRRLNKLHRRKDRPTDVLSFPLVESTLEPGMQTREGEQERLLGDVVISIETARRQAAEYDAPIENEIHRLLIHGLLHVLGHDHLEPEERTRMEAEERRLARAIGMPWPYDDDA